MNHVPDELLDEILDVVEDRHGIPHPENARYFEEQAHALAPGEPGRAAWLGHAGEEWELARDPAQALRCYEEAVADGGGALIDPRAELVGMLLELGQAERADAVLAELRQAVRDGDERGRVHDALGEALELHGRHEQALGWYSAGLTRSERERPGDPDIGCLNGRFRVRRALGLPIDRYDLLCEERRREYLDEIESADEERLLRAPGGSAPVALAVLYWPPAELTKMLQRWPGLSDDYGETHDEHRAHVERHLRAIAPARPGVTVAPGSFDDYVSFAQDRGDHAADASTRASYAAHLGRLGSGLLSWPPGRNERCWCGSGQKYKRCCGALRFPDDQARIGEQDEPDRQG